MLSFTDLVTSYSTRYHHQQSKMATESVKVEIVEKQTVKPSSQTPHVLRNFKLSLLDQFSPVVYIPFLLFYPNVGSTTTSNVTTLSAKAINERYQHLIKSLSEILTHYYPLAGRIKGNVVIICNDDGAEFVKARVKCSVSEILDHLDASPVWCCISFSNP